MALGYLTEAAVALKAGKKYPVKPGAGFGPDESDAPCEPDQAAGESWALLPCRRLY